MTDIKNSLSGAAGKASDFLDSATQGASRAIGDIDINKIAPYLLAGGIGAGAGALMTGKRRKKKGEGRLSHLGRVLGNALMAGGLAGGGAALLHKGYNSVTGAADDVTKATEPNEGPLESTVRGAAFSPLTAVGAGAAGLGLTHGNETFGVGPKAQAGQLQNFAKRLGLSPQDVSNSTAEEVDGLIKAKAKKMFAGTAGAGADAEARMVDFLNRGRRGANVAGGADKLHRIASRVSRSGPLSTFGPTWGRRAGRGALGLTAAALPALIGSFATKDRSEP